MENFENSLIKKLSEICKGKEGDSLQKKLEFLSKSKKLKEKRFYISLSLIIKENILVKSDFLGYKDVICKNIVEILQKNEFDEENIFQFFINVNDDKFKKILYISYLICKKTSIYLLNILFSILTQKKLDRLNTLHITNVQSNDFFVFLIDRNNIDDLKKEKDNIKEKIDINKFIKCDNNDYINYINKDIIKDKEEKENFVENNNKNTNNLSDENNNINNNNIHNEENNENDNNIIINNESNNIIINNVTNNIIINESNKSKINDEKKKITNNEINNIIINENNKKELNDERIDRIKSLINNSLPIVCNKNLKEIPSLKANYIKFEKIKNQAEMEDILIDEYESTDKSKLNIFSPISLLINNIKKKFEKNDFEIFNEDNNYIEMFGFYLEEIISKLNSFINDGKEKDYINNNKIKFGCYHGHYYLCCQLNDEFKQQYYKEKQLNKDMVKNKSAEENLFTGKNKKEIANKYSAAQTANINYRNKMAYAFEKEVSEFISDKDCENLNNIMFFFNLKIPKIIEFQSVRLSFSENLGKLYGFREIDICMKNKNKRTIDQKEILTNNICYINTGKNFNKMRVQEIDISLKEDSIIFCEVKNSFSTIDEGKEKCSEIKVKKIGNDINSNLTFDYMDRIENLYKKSKIFYNFFINEGVIDETKFMHILYLYDESNVNSWDISFNKIEENIFNFLTNQHTSKGYKNIIFQVAYFDKEKNLEYQKKSFRDFKRAKEQEIQNLANKLKESELENERLKNIIKAHNIKDEG